MVGIINIAFYIAITCYIATNVKSSFARALPISSAILLLILFFLSIINRLNWIDYISIGFLVFFIVVALIKKYQVTIFLPHIALFVLLVVTYIFLCNNHVTYLADDLRYWALETKTIYLLNGFSAKGYDAAYLYGNYHPGLVLFMWWLCHFSTTGFSDMMVFAGYWILFSIPIISLMGEKTTWKRVPVFYALIVIVTIILPSVVISEGYESIIVEYPMASCFGLLLIEMIRKDEKKESNIILYSSIVAIMTLLKSVGLLWALLALLLYFIINKHYRNILIPGLCGIGIFVMWKVYCAIMDRNSYYSADISHTIREIQWNGRRPFVEDLIAYIKSYFLAFVKEPLHCSRASILNIVPILFVVLFVGLIIWLTKKRVFSKREGKVLAISYVVAQTIFSITLITMCTFVFRENQFKEPDSMICLIARYGANFYLGALFFVVFLISITWEKISKKSKYIVAVVCGILLLICSDFGNVYNLVDNKEEIKKYVRAKNDEIESRYSDALLSGSNEAVLVENSEEDSLYDRYFYIQYVGTPIKLIIKSSTPENLLESIEEYKKEYETDNIFTYGF